MLGWSSLNRLGQSRMLRSSYVWFFVIPFAVTSRGALLVAFPEVFRELALPFSWQVFYYAAVAFAGATLIYSLYCPEIVRLYPSYASYEEAGRGGRQLSEYFSDFLFRPGLVRRFFAAGERTRITLGEKYLDFAADPRVVFGAVEDEADPEEVRRAMRLIEVEPTQTRDAFWFVWRYADTSFRTPRLVCALLYMVGFGLAAVVVVDNFFTVLQYSLSSL